MTDADRLRAAIDRAKAAGMDVQDFCLTVLLREPRTVRRWIAENTVPRPVRAWLDREEAATKA